MHDAPKHRPAAAVLVLRGGNARAERGGGLEQSVFHAQRLEDVLRAVDVQRLAGNAAHNFPQGLKIDVAVDEARAGRHIELGSHDHLHGGVIARPRGFQFQVRGQAGIMRHQFPDGDQLFAVLLEFRPVIADRRAEHNFALLHKLHHGRRGGHHFGHRGQVKDRVHGHRPPFGHQGALAKSFSIDNLALVADQDDSAGNLFGLNRGFHERSNSLQALFIQVRRGLCGRRRQNLLSKGTAPRH